jgi:hypothetical protein
VSRFRVHGLGFRITFRFRVWSTGFGGWSFGVGVLGWSFGVSGSRANGLRYNVSCRVLGVGSQGVR